MLSANDAHRHSRRSMHSSSTHSVMAEPIQRIFKVLESEDEYLNAKNSVPKEKPTETDQSQQQQQLQPPTSSKGNTSSANNNSSASSTNPNACCFIYVSPSLCPPNARTVTMAQEAAERGDADEIDFFVCDVAGALGKDIAQKYDKPGSLPTFVFYFRGQKLESYSGDSSDKFKICCKAALAKRQQAIKQKEKEDAEKAAAAATANQ